MPTVTSTDGTRIAFEQTGHGPVLILVLGAFNTRADGAPLAQALAPHFTVINYDRRGRGESGDTAPYAVAREIEDLAALITAAGGTARVFGYSSGAILATRAAAHATGISRLALYEPPPTGADQSNLAPRLAALADAGRRGDAVELFQSEGVGIPPAVVAQLRHAPFRPALENMAHTLAYEMLICGPLPAELTSAVRVPTLVIYGAQSPERMQQAARSLAAALPQARALPLAGQTHDIVPDVLAPVLEQFCLA